ncbi:hypothetical protein HN51_033924 [Arachis hypogaea]|uniref:Auxin response factor n=1 Tax=Arachis hypogaea TaxID=3818 RepID=A0A445AA04_ARAHY|nr:auxin response factor 10-like [Arachis ipaensis]XP_025641775.1 auxin response factor 10 [Arachis hypogaea]XP_029147205.1 auxin response factor 10 [Arachis hypogaea]QHN98684.1 Auxin response factor [Arachis hypogaea]RYR23275.1 hypothetical protein Ahy_B03g068524 isoform A [Arachis hypogaea]RYR23276.1 hypothetical protein Ahy_B03g068524 isoform B [Arachis hypogaea]
MKEGEKSLDPQLWHACAGSMVQMPQVNSKVFYFPQGHAEHAQTAIDLSTPSLRVPPLIPCRVATVRFMADPETDEVFAKIKLVPLKSSELDQNDNTLEGEVVVENQEKPASFAKTLTQSDANNGGGFSVPRYCAETIFPRLDYSAEPPVQTVVAKDVHGELWKFRHIYRGTPRRHLLTTGWSTFVNQKKLVAGDSVVFLRAENGDLCVGIRRAKRGIGIGIGGGCEGSSLWSSASSGNGNSNGGPYGALSMFLREENNKLLRNSNGRCSYSSSSSSSRVRAEDVVEAVSMAARNQAFEVVYSPRASTPEFCIKASSVSDAMRIQWCSGMRFKMPFETEDSSRISWFMGTVASVQVADPIRWPNSPWRILQVTWDEPDLLQNVKRVSPWLVELVSNMPIINISPFSPPRKKLRFPQHPDFPQDIQFTSLPTFPGNYIGPNSPMYCLSENAPASIQGTRHAQIGISLSDFHLSNKLQLGLLPTSIHRLDVHNRDMTNHDKSKESLSCLLTMGKSNKSLENSDNNVKTHQFLLFGQPILTEQQISRTGKDSPDETKIKEKCFLGEAKFAVSQHIPPGKASNAAEFSWQIGLETSHCKVFLESEDVGRTLDLSSLGSYEELYRKLANMFDMERSEIFNHVLYRDETSAVKKIGEEPFSEFMKTAKRLTILMDSSSKNIRRAWITGSRSGEHGIDASNKTGPLSIFV